MRTVHNVKTGNCIHKDGSLLLLLLPNYQICRLIAGCHFAVYQQI